MIPIELLNVHTLAVLAMAFNKNPRAVKLTNDESICMDAIWDTGLVHRQTVTKKMLVEPCPLDSLHWIVTYCLYHQTHGSYFLGPTVLDARRWSQDTNYRGGLLSPTTEDRSGMDLCMAIAAHNDPTNWTRPENWCYIQGTKPYTHACYGLVRQAAGMNNYRVADLIRLLSGNLPPCPGWEHAVPPDPSREREWPLDGEDTDDTSG